MSAGDKPDPTERSSTDESLQQERDKTDAELAARSGATEVAATEAITEARDKADSVLSDARAREDARNAHEMSVQSQRDLSRERAHEDAALQVQRRGADAAVRDESEQRRVALASLLAFERDDTDMRLEVERERADEALTTRENLMAMVSHDLRSLLGGIALSAELLRNLDATDEPLVKVKKYAEKIQRFSARMSRLVGDLMDVASIESGKLAMVRSRCEPRVVLREALDAFHPAAFARGVELVGEMLTDPGAHLFDHDRILQVLTNLVGNALQFTPKGGRITIRVDQSDAAARFSVQDTGQGVPPELLESIFERHVQIAPGERRGLGLGLFISRSIVEAHGGWIWATSTPGVGSTFVFTLPLAATP